MKVRRGQATDLPELIKLEADSFEPSRCESGDVIKRSLNSPHQEVWVCVDGDQVFGALFLRIHKHSCRIYSIAVDKQLRGKGIGRVLLEHARGRALARGCRSIFLEADGRNHALLSWYAANGYKQVKIIRGYYGPEWDAVRFHMNLKQNAVSTCQ